MNRGSAQLASRKPMARGSIDASPKPAKGQPRMRKCACCRAPFEPRSMTHKACTPECAEVVGKAVEAKKRAAKERADRRETKLKLLALEPLEYFLKKAERACNAYIRARDAGQGCISCGRHDADVWNAGHFISVGANGTLRFDEDNIHLQCARPCNKDRGGNIVEYRKALLVKIGPERLARLESWHPPVKRTRDEVLAIEAHYKDKLKALRSSNK
jgi:hypothetical protein